MSRSRLPRYASPATRTKAFRLPLSEIIVLAGGVLFVTQVLMA